MQNTFAGTIYLLILYLIDLKDLFLAVQVMIVMTNMFIVAIFLSNFLVFVEKHDKPSIVRLLLFR